MPIFLLLLLGGVGVVAIATASSKKPTVKPSGFAGLFGSVVNVLSSTTTAKPGLYGIVKANPYPSKPYALDKPKSGDRLPSTSPTGSPWVMWQGSRTYPFMTPSGIGHGIDRDGVQWGFFPLSGGGGESISFSPGMTNLVIEKGIGRAVPMIPASIGSLPSSGGLGVVLNPSQWAFGIYDPSAKGGGFASIVMDALNNYVVPAIAVAIGTLAGGVGGILAAAAWTAWAKIARGVPISQALINGARDALPSLLESGAFDQALDLARNNPAAMAAARAALNTPDARVAFDSGIIFAKAEKYQKQAFDALKKAMPDEANKIQYALDQGAQLLDVANAYAGASGVNLVNKIVTQH